MRTNQRGFGPVTIILIILVLGLVGLTGWYVWKSTGNNSKAAIKAATVTNYAECVKAGGKILESFPEVCVTDDNKQFTNPDQKATPAADATIYLTIKEWGVRMPVVTSIKDLTYVFHSTEVGEYATFTFQRLIDDGLCKTDVGVAVSRTKTNNSPPYTLDNPQSFKHIGEYYYYQAFGSSPCYDTTDKSHVDLVTKINGGDMKGAITNTLNNLEATPGQ